MKSIHHFSLLLGLLALPGDLFAQGSLTPPGAPATTMKSLAQIEPRTPISSLPITISIPGSYYVTTNLSVSSAVNGITVSADNVTIDLSGFTLTGTVGSFAGILGPTSGKNLAVRNGTLQNWGSAGLFAPTTTSCFFESMLAFSNGLSGLRTGDNGSIVNCTASANGTVSASAGIQTGAGGLVRDCVSSGNTGDGISIGNSSNVRGCTVRANTGNGIVTATDVGVKDCVSSGNSLNNIVGGLGSTIIGCIASSSTSSNGIQVSGRTTVAENTCAGNFVAGIRVTSLVNRIDGNNVMANSGEGIKVDSSGAPGSGGNLIIRNSARQNSGGNYSIGGTNVVGATILVGIGADTTTGVITNNSPWANFSY